MIKNNKFLVIFTLVILISSFGIVRAEDSNNLASSTNKKEQKQLEKSDKVRSAADKQLDQRIENLGKLKDKVNKFKNINDNDRNSIIAIVDQLVSKLNTLKNTIDSATSTTLIKEYRDSITENYRVYMLINPELNIIASADRISTVISMMNIIGAKLETRLEAVGTSSSITLANLTLANKTLTDLKTKIVDAQTNVQEAIKMVAPLMPDQGDKTIMESNLKTLKDARAKIKVAHNDLIAAKKDAEIIVKILGKDKKIEKNSDNKEQSSTTTSARTER